MNAAPPPLPPAGRRLRIGVVGAGAMGRNHIRILSSLSGAELVGIHDPRPEAAEAARREHGARLFGRLEELASEVEAAVLAVPTVAHAEVGCTLLARGVHLLVEKPLADNLPAADRLLEAAAAAGRELEVGHVEFFNPAVQALVRLGVPPRFVEVQRLAVFSPRSLDVDVVLDLMIHDLQILHALDGSPLAEVRATGIPVLSPRTDIANARLELASGCVANLTASRVSAERVRKLRAFLPRRYYSLDYQAQEIHGFRLEESGMGRRIVPDDLAVERAEPLRRELEAFVARCRRRLGLGAAGDPAHVANVAAPGTAGDSGEEAGPVPEATAEASLGDSASGGGPGPAAPATRLPRVDGASGRRALASALAVAAAIRSI